MLVALLASASAFATCSPELATDVWVTCWNDAAHATLADDAAKAFAAQWKGRSTEERAQAREQLSTTDAAWHLGRALVLHGLDHSLAKAVLDAHTPAHDERLVWYTGQVADRVWTSWVDAEKRYVKDPTEPHRAMADAARTMKNVFYDHVLALRRTGADPSKALERCMAYVGVDTYCGGIEASERTHNGW